MGASSLALWASAEDSMVASRDDGEVRGRRRASGLAICCYLLNSRRSMEIQRQVTVIKEKPRYCLG